MEVGLVLAPEDQITGVTTNASGQGSICFEPQSPNDSLGNVGCFMSSNWLACFPVEHQHQRLLDTSKRIGGFVQTSKGNLLTILAKCHASHTTVINSLTAMIGV